MARVLVPTMMATRADAMRGALCHRWGRTASPSRHGPTANGTNSVDAFSEAAEAATMKIERVVPPVAFDNGANELLAVVDHGCGLGLDKRSEAQVLCRCFFQNICFTIRPACRPHGTGASVFRIRRWSPRCRCAIEWGTTVERTPPIFPQFAGGNHDLFTLDDWEKREWSPL